MKTLKKFVAILAVAMLLCSMLPLSVMAAETTVVFEFGANGSAAHVDGNAYSGTKSYTQDGYTLSLAGLSKVYGPAYDAKGNSCIKLGTSSVVGAFNFTVPDEVTSVIIAVAKYKSNTTKIKVNDVPYTLTKNSNNGEYDQIVVDTTENKKVTFTTVSGGVRAMINSITYVIATSSADCDHDSLNCGDTCGECGEFVKEHKFSSNCVAECENGCGEANPDYNGGHVYTSDYDVSCNVCYAERNDSLLPAEGEALSLELANAIGAGQDKSSYTTQKYYITGIITSVANTTYGNINIEDADGNKFYLYGLYSFDGKNRYDKLEYKPVAGDEITVYGVIGNYNGAPQMQNGWLDEVVVNCNHEPEYDCSTTCYKCGAVVWPDAKCVSDAEFLCQEGTCDFCGETVSALEHAFDNAYDADCNYGCGYTREVEEAPAGYAPITSADQFVSGQYILVVNTGYAPSHYENGWVLPSQPAIVDGVITDAEGFLWTLTVEGDTVKIQDINGVYIAPKGGNNNGITNSEYAWAWSFADGVFTFAGTGSDTVKLACNTDATNGLNRFRGYKTSTLSGSTANLYRTEFTLYAAATSSNPDEPTCEHNKLACGETCAICGEYVKEHVFANNCAATCSNCDVANPNYADHVYNGIYDASCNVCGAVREVTLPEADSELTIEEVIALGQSKDHNSYTSGKYYVTGVITEVYNTTYGNMKLTDDKGNILTIYGTYSADGSTRYDAMENAPVVGDTVTIYGIVGQYNGTSQIKNGWITKVTKPCAHEYDNACDVDCNLCYEGREVEHSVKHVEKKVPTCIDMGNLEHWYCEACGMAWLNAECTINTNLKAVKLPATGEHTYDGDTDADCNVCGEIREIAIFSQLLVQFIGRMPSNDPKNRLYVSLSNDGATWTDAVEYGGLGMDVWGCANSTTGDWMTYFGTIDVTEIAKSLTSDKFYVKVGMGAGVLDQVVLHQVRVVGTYTGATTETEFFWDDYSNLPAFGRDGSNAAEAAANLKANISNIVDANNVFLQQCNVGHQATGISPYHGGFYGEPENVNGYVVYAINQELPEEPSDKVFFEIYGRLPGDVNNHVQVLVSSDGSSWNQATLWGGPDGEHSAETYAKIDITNAVDMTANNLYVKVNLISYLAEWYSIRQIRVSFVSAEGAETTLMHVIYDDMAIGSEEYKSGMYIDSANVQLRGTYDPAANDPSGLTMNEDCDGQDGKVLGDNYITYKIVLKEEPVVDVLYGDADGDGEITALDATLLDQYVAGWEVTLNEASADADGDGEITALDATLLDQYVAGWDVELGPDEPVEPEEPENKEFNDGTLTEWPQP